MQRKESFSDFSTLSVRSTIRRSIHARDKQTLGRGAALKCCPRYLTCCFVCSPDKRRVSNFTNTLWIHWCFCRQVFPPVLFHLLPGLFIYKNSKPSSPINTFSPQALLKMGKYLTNLIFPWKGAVGSTGGRLLSTLSASWFGWYSCRHLSSKPYCLMLLHFFLSQYLDKGRTRWRHIHFFFLCWCFSQASWQQTA